MMSREDIGGAFNEWTKKLDSAVAAKDGKAICEATRMVWSIGSILQAYFPGTFPSDVGERLVERFENALACIEERIEEDRYPDGDNFYPLYLRNVADRLGNLRDLIPKWCAVA